MEISLPLSSVQQVAHRYALTRDPHRDIADLDSEYRSIFASLRTGGLRPHFLDVCKPDFTRQTGMGFAGYMYTREVCTGWVNPLVVVARKSADTFRIAFSRDEHDINDSLESWM